MIRTAESVSPKHPDKMCDQISDAILDWVLAHDPYARVAIETVGGHGEVNIVGEISIPDFHLLALANEANNIVTRITGKNDLFVRLNLAQQSKEIAQGVDTGGAGDQGIMVGYATSETPELMPREVMLARSLNKFIYSKYPFDGKTQITIDGDKLLSAVASFQNVKYADLYMTVLEWIARNMVHYVGSYPNVFCNPAGDWDKGGFEADTGLTGRKLMIDNYGPRVAIGGGAFSGKDATKVDRSAAYMARFLAVQYLHSLKASEVYCYLAYAIGKAEPLQATVIADGKEMQMQSLESLAPHEIINFLDLRKPQFEQTAQWGHFGNNFNWETL